MSTSGAFSTRDCACSSRLKDSACPMVRHPHVRCLVKARSEKGNEVCAAFGRRKQAPEPPVWQITRTRRVTRGRRALSLPTTSSSLSSDPPTASFPRDSRWISKVQHPRRRSWHPNRTRSSASSANVMKSPSTHLVCRQAASSLGYEWDLMQLRRDAQSLTRNRGNGRSPGRAGPHRRRATRPWACRCSSSPRLLRGGPGQIRKSVGCFRCAFIFGGTGRPTARAFGGRPSDPCKAKLLPAQPGLIRLYHYFRNGLLPWPRTALHMIMTEHSPGHPGLRRPQPNTPFL